MTGVRIGKGVRIARRVRIVGNVVLGDRVSISESAVIEGRVRVGSGTWIQKQVEINGNVEIGADSVVSAYSFLTTAPDGNLRIGGDVLINAYSVIGASELVEIGDHCIFAAYVQITDAEHGIGKPGELIKHAPWQHSPVRIGDDVWLGSAAMITKGVTVGGGAVIGAKALVNCDVPPMCIAYGIPARVVRSRLNGPERAT
jgi:acetyltransferase-like isoleucine patch superfamily enzyme